MNHSSIQLRRRKPGHRADTTGRLLMGAIVVACLGLLVLGLTCLIHLNQRADAVTTYLSEVHYAPGYRNDVVAAGYHICGQIERGETFDGMVKLASEDGIGGDLYPTGGVLEVVRSAEEHLCPTVTR